MAILLRKGQAVEVPDNMAENLLRLYPDLFTAYNGVAQIIKSSEEETKGEDIPPLSPLDEKKNLKLGPKKAKGKVK